MKCEVQPEGNYYNKYNTKKIIEKWLMKNFFQKCSRLLKNVSLKDGKILEVGCGEGNFTHFLYEIFGRTALIDAFDISKNCIQKAKKKYPQINFEVGNIYNIKKHKRYDLVVASEVLEHMDKPEKAIKSILSVSSKYLFITVPNEPLWRILNMARGKYWKQLGNTPGHVQHWNKRNILNLILGVGGKIEVVETVRACPWLIILLKLDK